MPKITYASKEEIPAGLEKEAVEVEGKWQIDVVPASFRDRNIALLQERDGLKTKVDAYVKIVGDDITKVETELADLRGTAQRVKDGTLKKSDDIEAEVARRTGAIKSDLEGQIKAKADAAVEWEAKYGAKDAQFKALVLDQQITAAVMAAESGANTGALPDFLARARSVFKVKDDGTLVAMQGENVLYGADGESSMKPKEWLDRVLKEAPYLGKTSNGGGAAGGDGKGFQGTGLSDAEFQKLSPVERMTRARTAKK